MCIRLLVSATSKASSVAKEEMVNLKQGPQVKKMFNLLVVFCFIGKCVNILMV